MVWAKEQTHSSMEQNRQPRNKPTHIGLLIYDKGVKNIQWERTVSSISGVRKTGQPMQHNETGQLSYIIHKH